MLQNQKIALKKLFVFQNRGIFGEIFPLRSLSVSIVVVNQNVWPKSFDVFKFQISGCACDC